MALNEGVGDDDTIDAPPDQVVIRPEVLAVPCPACGAEPGDLCVRPDQDRTRASAHKQRRTVEIAVRSTGKRSKSQAKRKARAAREASIDEHYRRVRDEHDARQAKLRADSGFHAGLGPQRKRPPRRHNKGLCS